MIQGGASAKKIMIISLLVVIGMVLIGTFGYVLFGNSGGKSGGGSDAPPAPPAPAPTPAPPVPPGPPGPGPAQDTPFQIAFYGNNELCIVSNTEGLNLDFCNLDKRNQMFTTNGDINTRHILTSNGECLQENSNGTVTPGTCDRSTGSYWTGIGAPYFNANNSTTIFNMGSSECLALPDSDHNAGATVSIRGKDCTLKSSTWDIKYPPLKIISR
jgi:hypothetical protein